MHRKKKNFAKPYSAKLCDTTPIVMMPPTFELPTLPSTSPFKTRAVSVRNFQLDCRPMATASSGPVARTV